MSSNSLMMGYGGGDLLQTGTVWPTVGSLLRPVCAGCGQWPVWPAAPGPWRKRIRGGTAGPPAGLTAGLRRTRRCAIQIDSLYLYLLSKIPDSFLVGVYWEVAKGRSMVTSCDVIDDVTWPYDVIVWAVTLSRSCGGSWSDDRPQCLYRSHCLL